MQVIVDRQWRVLWSFIGEKGSAHDSTVFKSTDLYKKLMIIADDLMEKELYLVGDSAYALRGFMMCPYDFAAPNSREDNFNFFQSSTRIHVECAFGEINRRFGIFWKPLEGKLEGHKYTIEACFRLHNMIVDFREKMKAEGNFLDEEFECSELTVAAEIFNFENPGQIIGVVGDNERASGRPNFEETNERNKGIELRDKLSHQIEMAGIVRPTNSTRAPLYANTTNR